jgi:hypothetical protein
VQYSAEKLKEEVSAVSEQWHCCEVMSEQRIDLRSISSSRQWAVIIPDILNDHSIYLSVL